MKLQTDIACFVAGSAIAFSLTKYTNMKDYLNKLTKTQKIIAFSVFVIFSLMFYGEGSSIPLRIASYMVYTLAISSIFNLWA